MFKNPSLIAMIVLFFLGTFFLFFQHMPRGIIPSSTPSVSEGMLLDPNNVNGMALVYNGLPYTLNLKQQMQMIDFINHSNSFEGRFLPEKNLGFDSLSIYLFGDKEGLNLVPIVYFKNNLIFQIPKLKEGAFIEESEGKLKALISSLHD